MANIKISELEEMTETKDNDLLVIVDSATDTTKKIKGKNAGFGGGTYIGTEQPTKESYNVWINPDEITPVQQREEIYTEEEQVVGTWLGKPLYRKTIYVESLPNTATGKFDMEVSNVDTFMFDLSHCFWFNDTTSTPFMLAHTSSTYLSYSVLLSCSNRTTGQFEIITGQDRSGFSAYVTILYTKK